MQFRAVIFVDTGQVKATDFDIDEPTQDTLFANGRHGAEKFLIDWDFDRYVAAFRDGGTLDLTPHETAVEAG